MFRDALVRPSDNTYPGQEDVTVPFYASPMKPANNQSDADDCEQQNQNIDDVSNDLADIDVGVVGMWEPNMSDGEFVALFIRSICSAKE